MAMLSEPRQKKRYNLVPRGKALYETDDNRFGKKMMEKMGWSKEKGLGAREDGSKEFVRVRYKNDSNGLGFEDRDDQWTQHEQQFNGLLKSLNNSENNSDENDSNDISMATVGFGFKSAKQQSDSIKDKISGESLEEKSKMSKARVHYKKFTRGKDLTKCSEKDLANIFGKKLNSDAEMPTLAYGISLFDGKTESNANDKDSSNRYDMNTINTNVSVTDYFKNKLKKRKTVEIEKDDENLLCSEIPETNNGKKKKKKKKFEHNDENPEEIDEAKTSDENIPQESGTLKRKRKNKVNEEESLTTTSSAVTQVNISKKKKTSESMESQIKIEEETIMLSSQLDSPKDASSEMIKIKKKKKSKKSLSESNQDAEIESVEVTIKPKKKSKSNEVQANTTVIKVTDNCSDIDLSETIKAEKIKKSKKSLADPDLYTPENPNLIETTNDSQVKLKKRKHKWIEQELDDSNANIVDSNEDVDQTSSSWTTVGKKKKSKLHKESPPALNEQSGDAEQTEQVAQNNETEPGNPKVEIFEYEKETSTLYISSYCAEKFRHIDLGMFSGSSISDVVGYSLDDDINLKIIKCSNDERKIADLWNAALGDNSHKMHPNYKYYLKVHAAKKANKPMPKFNCKSNKRRTVFQKI